MIKKIRFDDGNIEIIKHHYICCCNYSCKERKDIVVHIKTCKAYKYLTDNSIFFRRKPKLKFINAIKKALRN